MLNFKEDLWNSDQNTPPPPPPPPPDTMMQIMVRNISLHENRVLRVSVLISWIIMFFSFVKRQAKLPSYTYLAFCCHVDRNPELCVFSTQITGCTTLPSLPPPIGARTLRRGSLGHALSMFMPNCTLLVIPRFGHSSWGTLSLPSVIKIQI